MQFEITYIESLAGQVVRIKTLIEAASLEAAEQIAIEASVPEHLFSISVRQAGWIN